MALGCYLTFLDLPTLFRHHDGFHDDRFLHNKYSHPAGSCLACSGQYSRSSNRSIFPLLNFQWKVIFIGVAVIIFIGMIIFNIVGESEPRLWVKNSLSGNLKVSTISYDEKIMKHGNA